MAEPISVRLDPETQRQLDAMREVWGCDISNGVRRAIRETYAAEVKRLSALRVDPLRQSDAEVFVARESDGTVAELRPAYL